MLPGQFISLAEETGLIVPLGALGAAAGPGRHGQVAARPAAARGRGTGRRPAPSRRARTSRSTCPPVSSATRGSSTACGRRCRSRRCHRRRCSSSSPSPSCSAATSRSGPTSTSCREIGVRLAIDDFGTGYSSLSYLIDLPIDVLKIDKTFVTGIASSWRRHALVEGIVRLARTLEVEVIAEGIETETERELLAGMGCQFGQGYLLSVPVEADEACGHARPRPRAGHRAAEAAAQEPGRAVPHRPVSGPAGAGNLARCGPAVWRPSATACLPSSSRSWCSSCASPCGTDLAALWHTTGPGLLSYLLSFVYVGIYWTNHHHMFQLTARVTGGILWANLALLFFLSLFPFTTQWMETTRYARTPVVVYGVNLLLAALAYYVLQTVIIRCAGPRLGAAQGDRHGHQGQDLPGFLHRRRPRRPARRRRHTAPPVPASGSRSPATSAPPSCGSSPTAALSAAWRRRIPPAPRPTPRPTPWATPATTDNSKKRCRSPSSRPVNVSLVPPQGHQTHIHTGTRLRCPAARRPRTRSRWAYLADGKFGATARGEAPRAGRDGGLRHGRPCPRRLRQRERGGHP